MNYTAQTFHLLRLAIARGLVAERIRPGVYRVPSHSREGVFYVVPVGGPCPCPSVGPCSHLALALDRWMLLEAPTLEYHDYESEKVRDRSELRLRILRRETTDADREYLKHCAEVYGVNRVGDGAPEPEPELAGCPF